MNNWPPNLVQNVPLAKGAVARDIKQYVVDGGFLFASARRLTPWISALAAEGVDIVDVPFDGNPPQPGTSPDWTTPEVWLSTLLPVYRSQSYEFSDIDIRPVLLLVCVIRTAITSPLFEFSANMIRFLPCLPRIM